MPGPRSDSDGRWTCDFCKQATGDIRPEPSAWRTWKTNWLGRRCSRNQARRIGRLLKNLCST